MRLIDLDSEYIQETLYRRGFKTRQDIEEWLNNAPTIDAVPVVRCKDCYYGSYDSKIDDAMVCIRTNDGYWRHGDDFCSDGRKKDAIEAWNRRAGEEDKHD